MEKIDIISLAKNAIAVEVTELESLKNRIDEQFEKAVNIINNSTGKLIVVGIGKSAHVGNKIVATLNSTGTPSQFLHAAEAIHGDLGVIQKNDVVLCISNSGNSPEVVYLLPFLKDYSSAFIGMTGNLKSKLAEASDVVLDSSVKVEACPNKLAPTSSTTVQMAIGDALAVCLMELNNFKDQDFAKFHPGGSLGRRLLLKVNDMMHKLDEIAICSQDEMVDEILLKMTNKNLGAACILEGEKIIGIITEGDIRRALKNREKFFEFTARDIMTTKFTSIKIDSMAIDAMEIMENRNSKIYQLPVVDDNNKLLGLIRLHDLVSVGA